VRVLDAGLQVFYVLKHLPADDEIKAAIEGGDVRADVADHHFVVGLGLGDSQLVAGNVKTDIMRSTWAPFCRDGGSSTRPDVKDGDVG